MSKISLWGFAAIFMLLAWVFGKDYLALTGFILIAAVVWIE